MTASDPFDLQRFVTAQEPVFAAVLSELDAGRKRSHWMWFVFPQLRRLGRSPTAQFYGIGSLAEARAYLAHPILGSRLAQCSRTVLRHRTHRLIEIFGSPDDLKFVSSMTLFAIADPDPGSPYREALAGWCDGAMDQATVRLLREAGEPVGD